MEKPLPEPPVNHGPPLPQAVSRAPGCLVGVLAGAGVGGICGALGRAVVALVFIYMVDAGGGSFFAGTFSTEAGLLDVIVVHRALLMISAAIGLVVCGAAGATCRVLIAAPIGALLSATPCFVLVVFPSTFLMSMSGGNNEPDVQAVWTALVAMIVVGAAAGGVGALAGKFAMRSKWRRA